MSDNLKIKNVVAGRNPIGTSLVRVGDAPKVVADSEVIAMGFAEMAKFVLNTVSTVDLHGRKFFYPGIKPAESSQALPGESVCFVINKFGRTIWLNEKFSNQADVASVALLDSFMTIESVSVGNRSTGVGTTPSRHLPGQSSDLEGELIQLRQQVGKLQQQNELQKSQIADARRTAARETQRYDQIACQLAEERQRSADLLDRINERSKNNDLLQSVLIAKNAGRLRMTETNRGVVAHAGTDEVTVVYDINDDIVEHVYQRSQFQDGRLPKEGDRLEVTVHVSEAEALPAEPRSICDAAPQRRDTLRAVPDEF